MGHKTFADSPVGFVSHHHKKGFLVGLDCTCGQDGTHPQEES